ncbi:hypothetical protein AALP_AAs63547U000100, partial [Arabis alpina]
ELPDLSTAINLEELSLHDCSSLIKLPSSIGNDINIKELDLGGCSSLVEFPSFIGNAINLRSLDLRGFLNLGKLPSSIWKATNMEYLNLSYCTNLVELPLSIGNLQKLKRLGLRGCSKLEVLPTNINLESLFELDLTDSSMLKSFPEISTNVNVLKLNGSAIEEVPPSIRSWPHLKELQKAGREVPAYFTHRATSGGSLTIKLNERPLPTSMRFKACILLVNQDEDEASKFDFLSVICGNGEHSLDPALTEHLYTFQVEADVTSSELVFEFKLLDCNDQWMIQECGIVQLMETMVKDVDESLRGGHDTGSPCIDSRSMALNMSLQELILNCGTVGRTRLRNGWQF